jgi:hypothetical protein
MELTLLTALVECSLVLVVSVIGVAFVWRNIG